jgi:hypothetical protein
MGDNPLDMVTNVGLNFMTGGLYSIGKAALSDDPMHALMVQGLDVGLASTFNQSLVDTFGDEAGMAFNAAGGAAGAIGAMGGFAAAGVPGFAAGGGVAPAAVGGSGLTGAAALTEGGPIVATGTPTTLAPGVLGSTTGADMAGAELAGSNVGLQAAPSVSGSLAPETAGYVGSAGAPASSGTGVLSSSLAPETAGYVGKGSAMDTATALKTFAAAPPGAAMDPAVKMALVLAGGQMATGSLGGLFTGMSAQKQLELQQLINSQNQNQRQYLNANNQYAPSLTFKKPVSKPVGILATPK